MASVTMARIRASRAWRCSSAANRLSTLPTGKAVLQAASTDICTVSTHVLSTTTRFIMCWACCWAITKSARAWEANSWKLEVCRAWRPAHRVASRRSAWSMTNPLGPRGDPSIIDGTLCRLRIHALLTIRPL
jgi:hypothetical protein